MIEREGGIGARVRETAEIGDARWSVTNAPSLLPSVAVPFDAGATIAERYVLTARLGEGAMGVVWRAHDSRLDRDVAVKVVNANAIGDAKARARLFREAKAAASFSHPHVIHVHDVGQTDDGGAYVVMELAVGVTLAEKLRDGAATHRDRLRWIGEAASALEAAHKVGMVHRDVKPDNMVVREDGRLVLLDFGLAKRTEEGTATITQLTQAGALMGTPAYMAPEQARGEEATAASDQWALAIVAYTMLTGRLPWRAKNVVVMLNEICQRDIEPPSTIAPSLPVAIDAVMARALAKDQEARYPSIGAFAQALAEAARDVHADSIPPRPSKATDDTATVRSSTNESLPKVSASVAAMPTLDAAATSRSASTPPSADAIRAPSPPPVAAADVGRSDRTLAGANRQSMMPMQVAVAVVAIAAVLAIVMVRRGPSFAPGRTPVPGANALPSAAVESILAPATSAWRRDCVEKHPEEKPGSVVVTLSIHPDGTVAQSQATQAPPGHAIGECVAPTLPALKFAPSVDGVATYTTTLKF